MVGDPGRVLGHHEVAATYRLRWDVERFYTCLKTGMGLRKINSRRKHIVELLVASALLRCTVAMRAMAQAQAHLPRLRWINPLQWVQVWREQLDELLRPWLRLGPIRRILSTHGRRGSQRGPWPALVGQRPRQGVLL